MIIGLNLLKLKMDICVKKASGLKKYDLSITKW